MRKVGARPALDAGEIQAAILLDELTGAMRPDRSASVFVGIDQRRQCNGRLDRRVQTQTNLAQEG
jgi:hypothetical protein